MSSEKRKPTIGISIGDINGIGPEVIIKALRDARMTRMFVPVIYGSGKVLAYYRKALNQEDFQYTQVRERGNFHPKKVNVVNCWEDTLELSPGTQTPEGGKYAFMALEQAMADLKEGLIDGLVTAPINKESMQQEGFNFPGHTEYITEKLEVRESLMMMVSSRA